MRDAVAGGYEATRIDRRSALKKAGVGIGLAWTAPVILSLPARAAGSCLTPGAVSWSSTIVTDTGGAAPFLTFSLDSTGMTTGTAILSNSNFASLGGTTSFVSINMSGQSVGDTAVLTLLFDGPVSNLTFSLLDLDVGGADPSDVVNNTWTDQAVLGDGGGTVTSTPHISVTEGPTQTYTGLFVDPSGVTNADGNVDLVFSGASVTTVTITYVAAGPGTQDQQIGLSDLAFCIDP